MPLPTGPSAVRLTASSVNTMSFTGHLFIIRVNVQKPRSARNNVSRNVQKRTTTGAPVQEITKRSPADRPGERPWRPPLSIRTPARRQDLLAKCCPSLVDHLLRSVCVARPWRWRQSAPHAAGPTSGLCTKQGLGSWPDSASPRFLREPAPTATAPLQGWLSDLAPSLLTSSPLKGV